MLTFWAFDMFFHIGGGKCDWMEDNNNNNRNSNNNNNIKMNAKTNPCSVLNLAIHFDWFFSFILWIKQNITKFAVKIVESFGIYKQWDIGIVCVSARLALFLCLSLSHHTKP